MRYIGCKKNLLSEISTLIENKVKNAQTFCDMFSGTVSVAKFFKPKYTIISNDLLYFSFVLQKANIELNETPNFKNLQSNLDVYCPIAYLNNIKNTTRTGFFEKNFSQKAKRMYFTQENAKKIDTIRTTIQEWKEKSLISEPEYFYLIASLIEAIPFVSNISGTYGAFNKTWDRRSFKDLTLIKPEICDNKKQNECYNEDANELIRKIKGDILYLDPPYNTRQYISNYHILETASLYDSPKLSGKTGLRIEENKKSSYCSKKNAANSLNDLIKHADFKHIILSYNTDGIVDEETIKSILCDSAKSKTLFIKEIPYRKFKSNSNTNKKELKELLFYIER